MAIIEEVVTLHDIISTACPIPGLPIAANVAQKIVNSINKSKVKNENFERLSSTIEAVVCSIYLQSLEIIDECNGKVPPALKECINELINGLDIVEDNCRKILSQGWLKRMINYRKNQTTIDTMISEMIYGTEDMKINVTRTLGQDDETVKEKERFANPTTATSRIPLPTPSSSKVRSSSAGNGGVYVVNSGNTVNTVVNESTISRPGIHTTDKNRKSGQASSSSSCWNNWAENLDNVTIVRNGIEVSYVNGVKYINGVRSKDNDNPTMVAEECRRTAQEARQMAEETTMHVLNSVAESFRRASTRRTDFHFQF